MVLGWRPREMLTPELIVSQLAGLSFLLARRLGCCLDCTGKGGWRSSARTRGVLAGDGGRA